MNIVVDASVLVAQLLRRSGFDLVLREDLSIVIAEPQWSETQHETVRRIERMVKHGKIDLRTANRYERRVGVLVDNGSIQVSTAIVYEQFETIARRRIPRDPNDWPTVALAIALNAGILTNDHDFLGCGCPTWPVETLLSELEDEPFRQ